MVRNEICIITKPNRADVLFGSGFEQNMHQGNVQYRQMIETRKSEYLATIYDKKKIAREIVNAVVVSKNGRFLKKMDAVDAKEAGVPVDVTAWIVVDDDAAIMEKVTGALRRQDSTAGKAAKTTSTSSRSKTSSKNSNVGEDASPVVPMENASSNVAAVAATTTTTTTTTPSSLFQAAMDGEKETVVQLLRQENANVNERDEHGFTPLMFACYHGHFHTAGYLLKKGAGADLQDYTGCTALYWAATRAHAKVACLLLKHNASIAIANQDGETPASVATGSCNNIDWDSFKHVQMITPENLCTVVGKNNNKRRKVATTDTAPDMSTIAGSLSNSDASLTATHARNDSVSHDYSTCRFLDHCRRARRRDQKACCRK